MPMSVTEILDERKMKPPKPMISTNYERALHKLRKIDRLLDRLVEAAKPEDDPVHGDDWEKVYDAVFSKDPKDIMLRAHRALAIAGMEFPDYYDPDGSYEDDVRAWIRAFKGAIEDVEERAQNDGHR